MGTLRDGSAVEPLLDMLSRGQSPHWEIVTALGMLGDLRAAPALVPLLSESAGSEHVADVLDALGWQPADDDLRVRYFMARRQWEQLARLGWGRASEFILESLQSEDDETRQWAVAALGVFNERAVCDSLIAALVDQNPDVAQSAADALAKVGGAEAVKPLVDYCSRYKPKGVYRNETRAPFGERLRAAERVRPLENLIERLETDISPQDLQLLLALRNTEYHLKVDYDGLYGDGGDPFTVLLDFSKVRDAAIKESRRRGLPIG